MRAKKASVSTLSERFISFFEKPKL